MILEMRDTLKNFFACRMRAGDEVIGVKDVDVRHAPLLCEVD
jgi:hypothetical protein